MAPLSLFSSISIREYLYKLLVEGEITMSGKRSPEQEKNIQKMNELLGKKNKGTSGKQDFDSQDQKNQSFKDNARSANDSNKLTHTSNRTP